MDKIKVLLVESNDEVRKALRKLIELEPDLMIVGESSNPEKTLSQVMTVSPDIVLMDTHLPGISCIELIKHIKSLNKSCDIILLSLYHEYAHHAVWSEGSGMVAKGGKRDELLNAIRKVRKGVLGIDDLLDSLEQSLQQ